MPPPRIGSPRRGRFTPAQRGGPARLGDAAQRGGSAHRALHERAQREALRLAEMERAEWLAARDRCL
ncbi:MAG TPA: hypothetical protein VN792_05365, partial [Candidatus Acidoferrales bacterium]|nr:hypothetical protein [Candidatus Acidoferrales bacterium]